MRPITLLAADLSTQQQPNISVSASAPTFSTSAPTPLSNGCWLDAGFNPKLLLGKLQVTESSSGCRPS